jgi:hypothetical protein
VLSLNPDINQKVTHELDTKRNLLGLKIIVSKKELNYEDVEISQLCHLNIFSHVKYEKED